ncbi:ammonia-dependent NAD(+) synthetase [Sulfobacillus harzensis]|uniref:NH(3)-dependent NAD(+) synthetase n=1 Tax=Sulfobacillus harzensis TaxID=2729629 RepID=A0A7Y0L852_9FIRM|nr:ammonia-dependent NAD(+) synthetase [Sulfobacillus harzensis]NMP24210.1 ammonia-dependent NAD(+) synthetase [Sulfobacillus harzensis]
MRRPTQQQIIDELHVKPVINPAEELRFRLDFLKGYLQFSRMKGFVLGISGGQDSSLAGRLCQLAVEELREETGSDYRFIALRLPYGVQKDEEDAQRALRFIRPDKSYVVNIKPAVDGAVQSFEEATGLKMSDFNKGNQKAQERMTVHYRFANAFNVLVVGTDHAAEALPGFFTKYGDGGVDLTPLSGLSKQQGRELLKHLGAPEDIYLKPPTADLLDEVPGRLDEDELGISYEVMDAFLTGKSVPEPVDERIIHRYQSTEHKRRLPVTPFDTWWQ